MTYASNKNVKHTGPNYLIYQGPLLYSEPQGILQKQSGRKPSENSEKVKIHLNKDFYSFLFNSLDFFWFEHNMWLSGIKVMPLVGKMER